MLGLMQNQPLLISSLIEFAERHHGDGEIVSRRVEGDIHRYTYRDLAGAPAAGQRAGCRRRAGRRARGHAGLERLPPHGDVLRRGGSGRVLHTINPRLHPEQIAWIVNHAEDRCCAST
jgi:fatty-acyl-CoA synthase